MPGSHWTPSPGPRPPLLGLCLQSRARADVSLRSLSPSVTSPPAIGGSGGSRFRCGAARPGGGGGGGGAGAAQRSGAERSRRDGAARAGCGGAGCPAPRQRLQRRGPRRAPQRLRARPARARHPGVCGGRPRPPGRGRHRGGGCWSPVSGVAAAGRARGAGRGPSPALSPRRAPPRCFGVLPPRCLVPLCEPPVLPRVGWGAGGACSRPARRGSGKPPRRGCSGVRQNFAGRRGSGLCPPPAFAWGREGAVPRSRACLGGLLGLCSPGW